MRPLKFILEAAGPYRTRQELPLVDLGLVLVRGDNQVSQSANSNGAGKSFLFSALSWNWYGETLPGPDGSVLRHDEIANRFTRAQCYTATHALDDGGNLCVLERTRRPASVRFTAPNVVLADAAAEAKWRALVGYGPLTFRNGLVFGQAAFDRLAQAEHDVIMKMFDEIHGLDLRRGLEKARAWLAHSQNRGVAAKAEAETARQQIAALLDQVTTLRAARDGFARDKTAHLETIQRAITLAEARVTEMETAVREARRAASVAENVVEQGRRFVTLRAACTAARAAAETARVVLGRSERAAQGIEQRVRDLAAAKVCPTCRRPTDNDGEFDIRRAFRKEQSAADADAKRDRTAYDATVRQVRDAETALARAEAEFGADFDARLQRAYADREPGKVAQLDEALTYARGVLTEAKTRARATRAAVWDGQALLDRTQAQIAEAQASVANLDAEQVRAGRTAAAAAYWVEAFGDRGLRLMLFRANELFLNERSAQHLGWLTAGEARVQVSGVEQLKKGKTRDRVSVAAQWAWGGESYKAGSPGQDRRIDLALFMAVQDLAERRSARPFPFRVWDEPGDALDARGRELFCAWIAQETTARGTGFLITHSDEIVGLVRPDRTLTVRFDARGSQLVWG